MAGSLLPERRPHEGEPADRHDASVPAGAHPIPQALSWVFPHRAPHLRSKIMEFCTNQSIILITFLNSLPKA
jgi:hypothetical protein